MSSARSSRARKLWPLAFSLSSGAMTLAFYVLIVDRYGVGKSTDLVFALSLLPSVLYTVTFGQLNEVLVPCFTEHRRPELMATAFWNVTAAVAIGGTVLGALAFFPMVRLALLLFHTATANCSPNVIRNLLLAALAYNLMFSLLVVKNSYLVSVGYAGFTQFIMTLGNAAAVLWLWRFGRAEDPLQVPLAQIAGTVVAMVWPATGAKFAMYVPGHVREQLTDAFIRVRWLIANASVSRTEPLFDSVIAGVLGTGAITVYYLFQRVVGFSQAVVQNGYILPFTKEASEITRDNPGGLAAALRKAAIESSGATGLLLISIATGLALMEHVPVAALQAYAAVYRQHSVVFFLLFGYGISTLTAKAYATGLFVVRRERLFTAVSVAMFFLSLGIKILSAGYWGLRGLAFASSLASVLYAGSLARVFLYAWRKQFTIVPLPRAVRRELGTVPE